MENMMSVFHEIESSIYRKANQIHQIAEDWFVSRWQVGEDVGSTKERNCSMKAFDLAQRFGIRVNKILGYNDEAAQFIQKDPIVYAISMVLYLGLNRLLVLVTKGNFKSND